MPVKECRISGQLQCVTHAEFVFELELLLYWQASLYLT